MDKVTRYSWHGSWIILVLLCLLFLPLGIVYILTHMLKIETSVSDAEDLTEFLRSRKRA